MKLPFVLFVAKQSLANQFQMRRRFANGRRSHREPAVNSLSTATLGPIVIATTSSARSTASSNPDIAVRYDKIPPHFSASATSLPSDYGNVLCQHDLGLQLSPSSYPQPGLVHEWQHRLSEELEVRRKIEECNLDPVAAGPFEPD